MRADASATLALAALVACAVGLGLWAVGGPAQGRAEKRDQQRHDDLMQLERQIACLSDAAGGVLPDTLSETDVCHIADRYADPYTGAAYVYERLSDTGYRLCAGFEAPTTLRSWTAPEIKLDTSAGCLVIRHTPG